MNYYNVFQIDDRTWRIEDSFKAYMYLLEGDNEAVLIDTGMGLPGLDSIVTKLTKNQIVVLNTHGHLDHIGGNKWFDNFYMSYLDQKVAEEHLSTEYRENIISSLLEEFSMRLNEHDLNELITTRNIEPFLDVTDKQILDLGNRTLEIITTPGHTNGSICVLDRERRNLFSADTVCDKGVLLLFEHSASVSTFLSSIQKLKKRQDEYDRIWPGHHTYPLGKEFLDAYEKCAIEICSSPNEGSIIESNFGSGRIQMNGSVSIAYKIEKI